MAKEPKVPVMFEEIVSEIVEFAGLPRSEVERRVWMEAMDLGWNVSRDAERFAVTANKYSKEMTQLYREGDGFIFETLVFWARPDRQLWSRRALDRIYSYSSRLGLKPQETKILMLGDGTGNDSLFLAKNGLTVDYFDVPDSKTFDFAVKRFQHYDILDKTVNIVTGYSDCLLREYDVVVSFEVLEHLPQPLKAIRDMRSMLKTGGIALMTEGFEYMSNRLPTHLKANAKYAGRTPFLFLRNGMLLTWYGKDPTFRPAEYTKSETNISVKNYVELMLNRDVLSSWFKSRVRRAKSLGKRIL